MTNRNFNAFEELDPILEQVLALPSAERLSFLQALQRDRPHLREGIQQLLEPAEADESLLENGPALRQLASEVFNYEKNQPSDRSQSVGSSLHSGQMFGSYEVLGPIGAGGMGQVFRARDLRLGREVALKLLPPDFQQDADRLARFEREAQLLATMNHPNITAIHELKIKSKMAYRPSFSSWSKARRWRSTSSAARWRRRRRSIWAGRSRPHSTLRTKRESFIEISSLPTSKSPPRARSRSSTSALGRTSIPKAVPRVPSPT